jgi:Cof subfamily protein (haloacid dehalogenase superfamily)
VSGDPLGFRLLLFDLDGTLLREDRSIHAPGRSRVSVTPYVEELQPNGPLILFNGGQVWMPGEDRAWLAFTLPAVITDRALSISSKQGLHANVYVGSDLFVEKRDDHSLASEIKDGVPHTEVGPLLIHLAKAGAPVTKILFIGEDTQLRQFETAFREDFSAACHVVRSEPTYLEILPAGVSKGMALGPVRDRLGISAGEVMAFGDNLNDLELIKMAGCGVAMGNAHPDLKRAADRTIGHHMEPALMDFLKDGFQVSGNALVPRPEAASTP